MNFWISDFENYNYIPNDYLCVSLTKNIPISFNKKNAIIPYDGIFDVPHIFIEDKFEDSYYYSINNKMRKKGFNGFNDYLIKMNNFYKNEIFHDENDKIIHYDNLVFMFNQNENNKHICSLLKLFKEFGVTINELKISKLNNNLF